MNKRRPEGGTEDEGATKKHKADEPSRPESKPGFAEVLKRFKESEQCAFLYIFLRHYFNASQRRLKEGQISGKGRRC